MTTTEQFETDSKFEVVAPSGSKFFLLTQDEADYFVERAHRYETQLKLTNVSDLQDLDRVMFMETLVWRWGSWLSQESDYWGGVVDQAKLNKTVSEYSNELRQLKKTLGIDKNTRERDKGESVVDYIENLRLRAKEFGVMREKQLTKAITLFQELKALVTLYENCDIKEREEQNVEINDVLEWIQKIAIPEFDEVDTYFQIHNQKTWIKTL